jgi:hypothetical protein
MYYGLVTYVHFQSAFNSINVSDKKVQQIDLLDIKVPTLRRVIGYQSLIDYSQNHYISNLNRLITGLYCNKNYTS